MMLVLGVGGACLRLDRRERIGAKTISWLLQMRIGTRAKSAVT
jgi:hypothetical protein